MRLATIICYCTADERFIRTCIDNALQISDQVIIPVSTHWFDGKSEDLESLQRLSEEYPSVNITTFEWTPGKHPRYWHNMSRVVGKHLIEGDVDWILYIDSDEIVEPSLFNKFKSGETFNDYDSYKLGCYWYFREPIYRSTSYECSPVIVRAELANIDVNNLSIEREQLHEALNVRKQSMILQDGKPMVHHYSWCRTKEQMLTKVRTWGHANDTDWTSLVLEEFSRDFNGTDFIHGYTYDVVEDTYKL